MKRKLFSLAAKSFVLVFVCAVNPAYLVGCEPSGEVDEKQIELALLDELTLLMESGPWAFTAHDGEDYEVSLELAQAEAEVAMIPEHLRLFKRARACGRHTFVRTASACSTTYELAVEGRLSLRRQSTGELVASDIEVVGTLSPELGLGVSIDAGADGYLELSKYTSGYVLTSFTGSKLGPDELDLTSN